MSVPHISRRHMLLGVGAAGDGNVFDIGLRLRRSPTRSPRW
ncbi:hypothetical protein ACFWQC_23710 [Nocardioides sp. NPDC058538]